MLSQKLVNEETFGIMDLLRPSVKRTQGFFSVSTLHFFDMMIMCLNSLLLISRIA